MKLYYIMLYIIFCYTMIYYIILYCCVAPKKILVRLRPALCAQGLGFLVRNLVRSPCAEPCAAPLCRTLCGNVFLSIFVSLLPFPLLLFFSLSFFVREADGTLNRELRWTRTSPKRFRFAALCGLVRRPCAPHGFLGMDGPCAASCFSDVPLHENPCESLCPSCVWQPFPCAPYAVFFFRWFFFKCNTVIYNI